jgi:uncharacterized protein
MPARTGQHCGETTTVVTITLLRHDRDPLAFLPGVAERLGWYVYALCDPRNGEVFYVGKGKGARVYQHARQAQKIVGESAIQLKLDRIRAIHDTGLKVGVEIVRHQIETEAIAYEVEAAIIDAFTLVGVALHNEVGGHSHERGWRPLEDIILEYGAAPVTIAREHRIVLIRINRRFRAARTPEALV